MHEHSLDFNFVFTNTRTHTHTGNYYSHLVSDSIDAANLLGGDLASAVMDIHALHYPFFSSSMPAFLQDMLINSLSHIRCDKLSLQLMTPLSLS